MSGRASTPSPRKICRDGDSAHRRVGGGFGAFLTGRHFVPRKTGPVQAHRSANKGSLLPNKLGFGRQKRVDDRRQPDLSRTRARFVPPVFHERVSKSRLGNGSTGDPSVLRVAMLTRNRRQATQKVVIATAGTWTGAKALDAGITNAPTTQLQTPNAHPSRMVERKPVMARPSVVPSCKPHAVAGTTADASQGGK